MQIFLDVDYLGHNIRVENKWNKCSLIINGEVVDYSNAIFAIKVTLRGNIAREYKQIVFQYKWTKLYLWANDEQILMIDLVTGEAIVSDEGQVTVNDFYGLSKGWYD